MFLQGCVSMTNTDGLVLRYEKDGEISGIPDARLPGDQVPAQLERFAPPDGSGSGDYLAISGGGANGAYGAGVLVGWSEHGDRPVFRIVTGVSTGALIAPFAFLGSEYDAALQELYTTTGERDILGWKPPLSVVFSGSIFDSQPLESRIRSIVDSEIVHRIAEEHLSGRRLLIGTTDLGTGKPVVWNIGAIAASSIDEAVKRDLVVSILLASASIPGVFPPVVIPVARGTEQSTEVHVDGGVSSQVFLYPPALDFRRVVLSAVSPAVPRVYIIQNAGTKPVPKTVLLRFGSIVSRSIDILTTYQGIGDLYRIYTATQRDGIAFFLASIPEDAVLESAIDFDPKNMEQLFRTGYLAARSGYPWARTPPGYR